MKQNINSSKAKTISTVIKTEVILWETDKTEFFPYQSLKHPYIKI
jgi:hypothetical protein